MLFPSLVLSSCSTCLPGASDSPAAWEKARAANIKGRIMARMGGFHYWISRGCQRISLSARPATSRIESSPRFSRLLHRTIEAIAVSARLGINQLKRDCGGDIRIHRDPVHEISGTLEHIGFVGAAGKLHGEDPVVEGSRSGEGEGRPGRGDGVQLG